MKKPNLPQWDITLTVPFKDGPAKIDLRFKKLTDTRNAYLGMRAEKVNLFRAKAAIDCFVKGDRRVETYGTAFCSYRDVWSSQRGRQEALKTAISGWPKADRKALWEAYMNYQKGTAHGN